jgi:hypothetical protein
MKKIISIKAILLISILIVSSCNKDILNFADKSNYNTGNYFKTPGEIRAGSTAIYNAFRYNAMMGCQWSEMFDVLGAEADPTAAALPNEPDIVPLWNYTYTNGNSTILRYWKSLYVAVLRSNLVIDKAKEYIATNGDDANHIVSQSMGEAYFLRGYAYFQLAFYWGRVPIRTTFDQAGNEDAPRSASADIVWAQAEKDLKTAKELLPDSWDTKNIGRATYGSATGFLGKLYLYNKKYTEADVEFAKLEANHGLLPLAKYLDNFGETNENNKESIFEIQLEWFAGNDLWGVFGVPEGQNKPSTQNAIPQLYGWNDWGNWTFPVRRVTDFVYNDESGSSYIDPRSKLTFYGGIGAMTWQNNLPTGPVPYDFANLGYWYKKLLNKENKVSENTMQSGNNLRLMRYADVLLMQAECKLFKGDIRGCIQYINKVRDRVGAFLYQGSYNQTQAFDLLKHERQIELMGEQHRFNDLKRWGILKEVMNIEMMAKFGKPNVEDKHYFFPIPQYEIDTNHGLGKVDNQWN